MPNEAAARRSVTLYAAGSLRRAFGDLLPLFEHAHATRVEALFGPAGLLRQRIEAGEGADVFASANMEHPRRLCEAGVFGEPISFARNEICAVVRRELAIGTAGLIDAMLDPGLVLATSTPGADPSGDYAQAVFEQLDQVRPGMGAVLAAKARPLLGGGFVSDVPAGRAPGPWLIETGHADIVLGYRSGALGLEKAGRCLVVALPETCAVTATYGLAIARRRNEAAHALAAFLTGEQARAVLLANGFLAPERKGDRHDI